MAHPRFPLARRAHVEAILGLYEYDAFMNRLLIEAGRSVVFFNILCLHAAHVRADRATWPTMRLLEQTLQPYGVSSARRAHDIVARLVATGYVDVRVAPMDRRARILTPTAKMLAHDNAWLAACYRPLHTMFPDPGYGPAMCRDPAYQQAHRKVGRGLFAAAVRLMADSPAVMLFMGREAGMMILTKLAQLGDPETGEVRRRMLFADVADRFGVSRTHVRNALRAAEDAGLIEMTERTVVMTRPLITAFDRFVAGTMAAHDLTFRLAMRGLDPTRPERGSHTDIVTNGLPPFDWGPNHSTSVLLGAQLDAKTPCAVAVTPMA